MNTYENMKKVIATGKKSSEDLLTMCDIFLMNNRITAEQYTELVNLINAE
ncbi:MAG: hypothetical protein QM644_19815 [Mobilitalea sp.]